MRSLQEIRSVHDTGLLSVRLSYYPLVANPRKGRQTRGSGQLWPPRFCPQAWSGSAHVASRQGHASRVSQHRLEHKNRAFIRWLKPASLPALTRSLGDCALHGGECLIDRLVLLPSCSIAAGGQSKLRLLRRLDLWPPLGLIAGDVMAKIPRGLDRGGNNILLALWRSHGPFAHDIPFALTTRLEGEETWS